MKPASIDTKRIVVRGEKFRKIVNVDNCLSEAALPRKYLESGPRFFRPASQMQIEYPGACMCHATALLVVFIPEVGMAQFSGLPYVRHNYAGYGNIVIPETDSSVGNLTEAQFQGLLLWMRRAGSRLAKINSKLAKENSGWSGKEVVTI